MTAEGGCHCGAVRWQAEGEALFHALCHCKDCRHHSGAPMVGWVLYKIDSVKVTKGSPKIYNSSEHGRRHFCADCGTGLFFNNEQLFPAHLDIQSSTYDDPGAIPPQAHVQFAEHLGWMESAHELPKFERFPPLG